MSAGDVILGILGTIGTLLAIVAVFRKGSADSIDKKRETELARLDTRLTAVEHDLNLVAPVAWRAVRAIRDSGIEFPVSEDEMDALERTRPLV